MALNTEFWLEVALEQYDRQPTFLENALDLSALVNNDKLHIPEAGDDPTVLLNNTTYPIAVNQRSDTDNEHTLETYDSENTTVLNIEDVELSYDKVASVTRRHVQSLINKQGDRSSFLYAPTTDGVNTPIIPTTGADDGRGNSIKGLVEADVLRLAERFDSIAPNQMRTLVLTTNHWYDLLASSSILRGQQERIGGNPGRITNAIFELYNFAIKIYDGASYYDKTDGSKLAYGATLDADSVRASFAFVDNEVFKSVGTTDVFFEDRASNPTGRADTFGLQQRFLAKPMRNKYIGAIYSVPTA